MNIITKLSFWMPSDLWKSNACTGGPPSFARLSFTYEQLWNPLIQIIFNNLVCSLHAISRVSKMHIHQSVDAVWGNTVGMSRYTEMLRSVDKTRKYFSVKFDGVDWTATWHQYKKVWFQVSLLCYLGVYVHRLPWYSFVKIKVTLEQAVKAQRRSLRIALLFL